MRAGEEDHQQATKETHNQAFKELLEIQMDMQVEKEGKEEDEIKCKEHLGSRPSSPTCGKRRCQFPFISSSVSRKDPLHHVNINEDYRLRLHLLHY
ncbi:hypothetical protein GN956_G24301 [Arapaima gigas]